MWAPCDTEYSEEDGREEGPEVARMVGSHGLRVGLSVLGRS